MTKIKGYINKGYFLVLLLTLIAPLLTFAQEPLGVENINTLRLRAESDGKKDVDKIMTVLTPFGMGIGSVFAGAMSGLMTGCIANEMSSDMPEAVGCTLIAVGSSPFFLALLKHYNTPPHPPIERLIGKHPEYVKAYVNAYSKKMHARQLIAASAGTVAGCGPHGGLAVYFLKIYENGFFIVNSKNKYTLSTPGRRGFQPRRCRVSK